MNKKLNLKKINALKATAVDLPRVEVSSSSSAQSPYFSPIAHRTRKQKIEKVDTEKPGKSLIKPKKEKLTEIESTENFSKKAVREHIKVEYDDKEASLEVKPDKQPIKRPSSDNNKIKQEKVDSADTASDTKQPKWEPKNWWQTFSNIREMRKEKNAPVDTMGCHKCADETVDEKTQRFHHLISLMLSSQTKDGVTYEAMVRLKKFGLTPTKMIKIQTAELEKLLHPVSFYKTKAKHIQKASQVLIDSFDSDIPRDIKGLVSLPGVGPKMAHICMRVAWNEITGIGVDTHVHRIVNRLKWVPKETKEPEQTRIALEKWLPFEYWTEINEMLVGFGQTICTPTNPKCGECLNYDICPSRVGKKTK